MLVWDGASIGAGGGSTEKAFAELPPSHFRGNVEMCRRLRETFKFQWLHFSFTVIDEWLGYQVRY